MFYIILISAIIIFILAYDENNTNKYSNKKSYKFSMAPLVLIGILIINYLTIQLLDLYFVRKHEKDYVDNIIE